jgi:hypothetical protein
MFGKTFGKRVADSSILGAPQGYLPARPDPDGETRIIPKAIWDGPHGDMLRQSGFLPDDPRNLALTSERMHEMADAATERMNAIVGKVNAHIPGVSVIPWAIIPWAVWQDLNADFLMKRDFLQSSPWNNMLLPADAESSAFLGLPQHPRVAQTGLDENLTHLIDELRLESHDEFDKTWAALSRGDWSALDRHEKFKNDQFQKLFALARYIANDVFGEAVCARHDELFGVGLTEVTG